MTHSRFSVQIQIGCLLDVWDCSALAEGQKVPFSFDDASGWIQCQPELQDKML